MVNLNIKYLKFAVEEHTTESRNLCLCSICLLFALLSREVSCYINVTFVYIHKTLELSYNSPDPEIPVTTSITSHLTTFQCME